jgi:predicted transcriptional regulator
VWSGHSCPLPLALHFLSRTPAFFEFRLVRILDLTRPGKWLELDSVDPHATQEREQAHALLDMLADEKVTAVRSLLAVMVEPLSRSLASAPVEEEDPTAETASAIDRGRASLARGEVVPHKDHADCWVGDFVKTISNTSNPAPITIALSAKLKAGH